MLLHLFTPGSLARSFACIRELPCPLLHSMPGWALNSDPSNHIGACPFFAAVRPLPRHGVSFACQHNIAVVVVCLPLVLIVSLSAGWWVGTYLFSSRCKGAQAAAHLGGGASTCWLGPFLHRAQTSRGHRNSISPFFVACRFSIVVSCLLYTSPSPRDLSTSRMPSSA